MKSQNLSCVLVDDDKMALLILQSLIEKTDYLQITGIFDNPIDAMHFLSKNKIDILFLDVEMPELSGLELIENLEQKPQIILTTSKANYALDAFNYDVVDYLLKPIYNYARFLRAIRKAKANCDKILQSKVIDHGTRSNDHIFIKVDSLLVNFNLEDIHYIEAAGDYVKIFNNLKPIFVHSKLGTVEEKLPSNDFVRVHRSYIVRLDKIKNIDNANLQLGGKIIPISNSYRNKLITKINTLS